RYSRTGRTSTAAGPPCCSRRWSRSPPGRRRPRPVSYRTDNHSPRRGTTMAIKPVVRYMLLCDDWHLDPDNNRRVTVVGLISNIHALDDPPYPLLYPELCVFLALTEGRGEGEGKIICVYE